MLEMRALSSLPFLPRQTAGWGLGLAENSSHSYRACAILAPHVTILLPNGILVGFILLCRQFDLWFATIPSRPVSRESSQDLTLTGILEGLESAPLGN